MSMMTPANGQGQLVPGTGYGTSTPDERRTYDVSGAYMSKPQLYGGFGGFPKDGKIIRRQRQRMNLLAVCQCLFYPWLTFCLVFGLFSFNLHYSQPWLCYLAVGAVSIIVLVIGVGAVTSIMNKIKLDESREPTWFVFLFLTMTIAIITGAVLGNMNFSSFMQRYYDYNNLNDYSFVDASRMRGEQMMDGGRLSFVPGSTLDLRKAMGFKNLDTYCVAPVTVSDSNQMRAELSNYDFWAVGMNCCSGDLSDFHCGEFDNPKALGGVRLLEDDTRAFYRLAVQQAEALYHIKARHPLFLYWTQEPKKEIDSWKDEGYKFFFIAMLAHFCWQLLCVVLGVVGFIRMGHY
jgi:hypothetical protein